MANDAHWEQAVGAFGTEVERLLDEHGGATPAALAAVHLALEGLAARSELFTLTDFPLPTEGKSERYLLYAGPDGCPSVYLNTVLPGKASWPHNHKTWAVVSSVQGVELNRLYRLAAPGASPGITVTREVEVGPGQALLFGPEDIHSVHFNGSKPGIQIHCYGQPLETLAGRQGFDPVTGAAVNYNAVVMKKTAARPA